MHGEFQNTFILTSKIVHSTRCFQTRHQLHNLCMQMIMAKNAWIVNKINFSSPAVGFLSQESVTYYTISFPRGPRSLDQSIDRSTNHIPGGHLSRLQRNGNFFIASKHTHTHDHWNLHKAFPAKIIGAELPT